MILANNYSYPGHVVVSDYSKNLIQSILQINPAHRASLHNISAHSFFKGFIPESLPSSALRDAPTLSQLQDFAEVGSSSAFPSTKLSSGSRPLSVRDENDAHAINLRTSPTRKARESLSSRSSGALVKPAPKVDSAVGSNVRRSSQSQVPLRSVVDGRSRPFSVQSSKMTEITGNKKPETYSTQNFGRQQTALSTQWAKPSEKAEASGSRESDKDYKENIKPVIEGHGNGAGNDRKSMDAAESDFDDADVNDEVDELQLQDLKISDGRKIGGAPSREVNVLV